MRQTVTIEIEVDLTASVDDDGLTVESWDVFGVTDYEKIGRKVVEHAFLNAHPGDWE